MVVEQLKKRIANINKSEETNRKYYQRIRIRDYLAGQAIYTLGDYPARVYTAPTDYDRALVKKLADSGVQMIQLHEDWNDCCRLYGADKFSSSDPDGTRAFVELCHAHGIKVIAYVSTGYFHEKDPDFREEYTVSKTDALASLYFKYRKCDHGHPVWRNYITEKTLNAMDTYGFDGIYNDWGYSNYNWDLGNCVIPEGFYDPELEDALGEIYSKIHQRGGIYKLHCDLNNKPPCKDRVYDYLWIGEGMKDSKIGVGKDYYPYVVPCQDLKYEKDRSIDAFYAYTIPFMQFPLLKIGRIIHGNNLDIPGVTYYDKPGKGLGNFYRRVQEYNAAHPDGPYVYSHWSNIPDDPEDFPTWAKYFALYKPMVTENSVAYLELSECDEILSPIGDRIIASMFVNEETYLVLSNLSDASYQLKLKERWKNRQSGEIASEFTVEKEQILFLEKE